MKLFGGGGARSDSGGLGGVLLYNKTTATIQTTNYTLTSSRVKLREAGRQAGIAYIVKDRRHQIEGTFKADTKHLWGMWSCGGAR